MNAFNVFRRDIPAFRYTVGSGDDTGVYVEGTESSFTIKASCQNTRPEDVEYLNENRRNNGSTYRIYTNDVLRTIESSENPDQVELFGKRYQLSQSEQWVNNVISHNKYLAVRVVSK
tara:strand:- start:892 stop:1242 length:351 start_codon:yes stop_codon:yes gene_type:complete